MTDVFRNVRGDLFHAACESTPGATKLTPDEIAELDDLDVCFVCDLGFGDDDDDDDYDDEEIEDDEDEDEE